jgi:hypothetical protein
MKYIIEIPDDVQYVLLNGKADNKYYTAVRPVAELEVLNSDYINENFGELQDEAYQRGHDDGYEAGCATAFKPVSDAEYQRGYDEGYKKCLSENDFDQPCISCEGYKRGLEDAWEAARKIALMDTETSENVTGYFGLFRIMENLTAMQAIEKLKAYEDKRSDRIEVGDEVTFLPNDRKGIVTACHVPDVYAENDKYAVFCGTTVEYVLRQHITKTGKHYDIASILEAMKS